MRRVLRKLSQWDLGVSSEHRPLVGEGRARVVPPWVDPYSEGEGVRIIHGSLFSVGACHGWIKNLKTDAELASRHWHDLTAEMIEMRFGMKTASVVRFMQERFRLSIDGGAGREFRTLLRQQFGIDIDTRSVQVASGHLAETLWVHEGKMYSWPPDDDGNIKELEYEPNS